VTEGRQPQYITLSEWARRKFVTPPHRNTLHRWATDGSIVPAPWKAGRDYMVTPDARHINEPAPGSRLVDRLGLASA
jgi:hypothetical protein